MTSQSGTGMHWAVQLFALLFLSCLRIPRLLLISVNCLEAIWWKKAGKKCHACTHSIKFSSAHEKQSGSLPCCKAALERGQLGLNAVGMPTPRAGNRMGQMGFVGCTDHFKLYFPSTFAHLHASYMQLVYRWGYTWIVVYDGCSQTLHGVRS